MAIIKGNELILFKGDGTTNEVFSRSTSCTLERSAEMLDITSKSSGEDKEYIAGRKEWSISVDGLVDFADVNGYEALDAAYESGADVGFVMGIATTGADTKPTGLDATKKYYKGTVKVTSLTLNTANAGELVTYSASLNGTGKLETVTEKI